MICLYKKRGQKKSEKGNKKILLFYRSRTIKKQINLKDAKKNGFSEQKKKNRR